MDRASKGIDRLIDEHFGFEAADDVEEVLATLTDDASHHLVGSPFGIVTDRDAIRRFYETLFADVKGESVEPVGRWYGDGFVVDEAIWTGRIEDARCFGRPGLSGSATFGSCTSSSSTAS